MGIMSKKFKIHLIGMLILFIFSSSIQVVYSQDDAVAWFNRGTKAQDQQEKITCYLEAIKLNPKFSEAYYNLGYVYKNLSDFISAEKAFRQALLIDPEKLNTEDKLRITYELGITLKKLNRYNEALETLESAKNLAQKTEIRAAVLYELGRTKLLMEDFDGALTEFNEGMQLNSSKQIAFQAAIQNATMFKEIDIYYTQGINSLINAQYDEAIEALTKVVETSPNYKNASQKLAEARDLINQKTKNENLSNIYARGIGYMKNKDWENAIIAFQQVEKEDPNYKDIRVKLEEAKTSLDQSLQEEIYEKLYTDAVSEYRKGNWVKAIVTFEKIQKWNPDYKNINRLHRDAQYRLTQEGENSAKNRYYVQGKSDLNTGNWQSAIASFEQVIRLDANYKDVHVLLKQAKNELENEARTKQLETYYTEGVNHFSNGEWLKAILAFEKAQQINPNFKDVSEKLQIAQSNVNRSIVADISTNSQNNQSFSQQQSGNWVMIAAILSILLVPAGVAFFAVPQTRAKWLLIQGNYQKAALIYESILLKKPNKVKLYPSLAHIYLLQNRNDDTARKVYDITLQMKISEEMKQKIDEVINKKYLDSMNRDNIVGLEEQLKRELHNLKGV